MALMNQYAGDDKWEAEIKKQDDLLHTCIWKGQSIFLLEGFIAQHRNAYVSIQQCAGHVEYQLPNKHTCVGYLLEGIQCPDPGLQVAMASIHTNNGLQGMHNNFKATATHILPYDPVIKRRAASTSPITLITHLFLVYKLMKLYDVTQVTSRRIESLHEILLPLLVTSVTTRVSSVLATLPEHSNLIVRAP